ncbi:hypothetical protein BJ875DRAFT_257864 [Amylocarpus encephaloides]|uniref:FAD-binding domain-containing protein n=1 Tax=Amylocarpus encephaloides TaxID=45428 RepID=A0A9P7YMJ6_9HELO|nr:hypothetical protein BJ875DRAFT_257864 [Amylocarpus encephaloides]
MLDEQKPIIIIGAGVIGLLLAQALKQSSIAFRIFDRDASISSRPAGWGLTVHWALPALEELLPAALLDQLSRVQVAPEVGRNDTGQFLFLNLENGETLWKIQPLRRLRVNREKLRGLLASGVDVQWGKRLEGFATSEEGAGVVHVKFQDGSRAEGRMLIGADGATSTLRRLLLGEKGEPRALPVRFLGTTLSLAPEKWKPLQDFDPLLFQGVHPHTGTYLWVSVLNSPEANGSLGTGAQHYDIQVNLSWSTEHGTGLEELGSRRERVAKMKELAGCLEERFRVLVEGISEEDDVVEVKLADWPCETWDNHMGRVELIGDAAHAMVMYRGEAANHGILDVRSLLSHLQAENRGEGMGAFEEEMRERTVWAVEMSRRACLDAHDFGKLDGGSAILARRTKGISGGNQ